MVKTSKNRPESKATDTATSRKALHSQLILVLSGLAAAFACGTCVGYQLGKRSCGPPSSLLSNGAVVALSSASFEAHLREHKHTLVKFYAPWCGHCKSLAPEYHAAALALHPKGVSLTEVDGTIETDLAAKYGVENYPMLLWFENGAKTEYSGDQPPSKTSIVEWVTSMTLPAVVQTRDLPAPGKLPQVVLYNPTLTEAFQSVAAANRFEAQWYFVKEKSSQPKVVLQHKGQEPVELLQFLEDPDALAEFFSEHSLPLLGELSGDTFAKYTGKALLWSLFPVKGSMSSVLATYGPVMTEVAEHVRGKYAVTYTDTGKFKEQIAGMLGISEFPAIVAQPSAGSKTKYVYRGTMTASAILQFLDDVEAGRLQPTLKSEPIPSSNPGPVRVVVSDSLQQEVFSKDKGDVLLEIYAPWCGSCKQLEPEYLKLARYVSSHKLGNLVSIAKIDGTANDLPPELEYTSFPTIYFVGAGSGLPDKYAGDRTAAAMWAWIQQRSANPQLQTQPFSEALEEL